MKKLIFLLYALFCNAYAMEIVEITHQEEQESFVSRGQFINQITYATIVHAHQENLKCIEKLKKTKEANPTEKTLLIVPQRERDMSYSSYGCLGGQGAACIVATTTCISNNPDPCFTSACCCHIPLSVGIPITAGLSIGGALVSVISYVVLSYCCKD